STNRRVRKFSLIQMDIMVRDPRSPYGWVFGTFQYNRKLRKKNPWENLVPVGLQWGNDPNISDDYSTPGMINNQQPSAASDSFPNGSAIRFVRTILFVRSWLPRIAPR